MSEACDYIKLRWFVLKPEVFGTHCACNTKVYLRKKSDITFHNTKVSVVKYSSSTLTNLQCCNRLNSIAFY